MRDGAACRYEFTFPLEAGKYDQVIIKVAKLSNMDLFAVDTQNYSSRNFKETILDAGDTYFLEYPNNLYVTAVSKSKWQTGYFELVYQFDDKDPDEVDRKMIKKTIALAMNQMRGN